MQEAAQCQISLSEQSGRGLASGGGYAFSLTVIESCDCGEQQVCSGGLLEVFLQSPTFFKLWF